MDIYIRLADMKYSKVSNKRFHTHYISKKIFPTTHSLLETTRLSVLRSILHVLLILNLIIFDIGVRLNSSDFVPKMYTLEVQGGSF